MKNIITPTITAILLFVFGLVWTFFLLLAMNGVMESTATKALIIYGILAILTIVLFSAGSSFGARFITAKMKSTTPWIISTLFVVGCSILGSIGIAIGSLIAMLSTGIN